jgi:predicted dehydrogenase
LCIRDRFGIMFVTITQGGAMTDPTAPSRAPRLRIGVVGFGQRAAIAEHVAASGVDAAVTAIADTTPEGRARAAAAYPDAAILDSTQALIVHGVDAAVVTTPDWTHGEIAVALLDAGVAVYLEKPLAITLEEADEVLAAAVRTDTPLYVGHNFRHAGVVRLMSEIVARGEIGEVKAVWCRHFVGNGGDYYFKDWHADRRRVNSLLLQKASHDLDVIHMLAGAPTRRVVGMGSLSLYGGNAERVERAGQIMPDWFSYDNWPPASQALNPVVDVEDVSMVMMTLENGVMASYEQCHYTPDYWRNYTVIGTEGRLENLGDTGGGVVRVWNRRRTWDLEGDRTYPIDGVESGHADADLLTMTEFLRHLAFGEPTSLSPVAAREAVAAGALATRSLRGGSVPLDVPALPADVVQHFTSRSTSPSLPAASR